MSYIQSTVRCVECDYEMNVSMGTFGGGIPDNCPNCGNKTPYEFISDGWVAKQKDENKGTENTNNG